MAGEVVIKLSYPIEAHGEQVSQLTLRRPRLKDLKGISMDNITGDLMIELVARLADIPPSAAGEIDAGDFEAIGEAFETFFPKRPGSDADGKPN